MKQWLRTNQGTGALIAVLSAGLIAFLWFQPWSSRVMRDGFTLGFFPMLGAGALLVCGLLMTVDTFRKEEPDELSEGRLTDIPVALAMLVAIFIYFQISRSAGFLLASPVYLFAFMYVLGARPIKTVVLIAIATTVVIYVAFSLLGIPLPRGPLF